MSLTAPVKPTPPAVPAVKLQPVESSSQNTAQPEQAAPKKEADQTVQKPAVSAKTEPPANNTTIINKVEPNDQNKVPLLAGQQTKEQVSSDNTHATTAEKPAVDHTTGSLDLYAAIICVILFTCVMVFLYLRHKAQMKNAQNQQQQRGAKRQKTRDKQAAPRTVFDYSANNTKEIIDMLTGPDDLPQDSPKIKDKIKNNVKSNFEIRV